MLEKNTVSEQFLMITDQNAHTGSQKVVEDWKNDVGILQQAERLIFRNCKTKKIERENYVLFFIDSSDYSLYFLWFTGYFPLPGQNNWKTCSVWQQCVVMGQNP